ncbi:MAG: hypothetical protein V1856_02420, partial [Candidatus Liptonbacteria bacterium]
MGTYEEWFELLRQEAEGALSGQEFLRGEEGIVRTASDRDLRAIAGVIGVGKEKTPPYRMGVACRLRAEQEEVFGRLKLRRAGLQE